MAEDKVKIEGMDFAFLANAATQLAMCDLHKIEKQALYGKDFVALVRKSRQYLNVALDCAIAQYTDADKGKE